MLMVGCKGLRFVITVSSCVIVALQAEFMDYLPKGEGNTKSFGGIEVTVKQIMKKADYTISTLNIADSKVIMAVIIDHRVLEA